MKLQLTKTVVTYSILVCLAIYFIVLHLNQSSFLTQLCQEDGTIEWLTAILYFGASFLFLYSCKKQNFKNLWYWFFVALFFVVAAEEISWGQRIFGFATPDNLNNVNVQDEFNFHNVEGVHDKVRAIGLLIVSAICYIMPISEKISVRVKHFYEKIKFPVYRLWLVGIVTIAILFMAVPRLLLGEVIFNLDEVGELYLAIGFFLFSAEYFYIEKT